MKQRPRRLRRTESIRSLVRENNLNTSDLIRPVFAAAGKSQPEEIPSMADCYHYPVEYLPGALAEPVELGLEAILLFGVPEIRDSEASRAYATDGITQRAVKKIKNTYPGLTVITDVCLCAFMDHGHCGVVRGDRIDNDASLKLLGRVARSHAAAGADFVAPSDMMDGRVNYIRSQLDENGHTDTGIISYSAKYASSLYGPFRNAADSAPEFGDRCSYQMDPGNAREALKEVRLDVKEGADIVMVKPALAYLDVIRRVKLEIDRPLAAYNVSGEYAMIKAAANAGYADEKELMFETTLSIKRAGADLIITYWADELLKLVAN